MSEAWRVKTYYDKRILIPTGDVLGAPRPDMLVCLTGVQASLLRNMCQYLHRRSTFVSEYRTTTYLAPTEEEWDDIQAIVAETEDILMGCEDLTQMLDAILAAALCACEGTGKTYADPVTGPIYENLEDDGIIEWAPDDGTPVPGADDWCALSQLVWQMNYEILTEYLQPLQEAAHNTLLFLVLQGLAVMLGGPAALVPGAVLYGVIVSLLDAWVEGELQSVETALLGNKFELVCAMHETFEDGGSYADAAAAAATVIDGVAAWSAIDKALFRATFAPWVMRLCQIAWTAQTEWAIAGVTPGYCDLCEYGWFITEYWVNAPPCPGPMTFAGGAVCNSNYWSTTGSNAQLIISPIRRLQAGIYTLYGHYDVKSQTPSGWNVGNIELWRSYDLVSWTRIMYKAVGSGVQNQWVERYTSVVNYTMTDDAYMYLRITGQDGQAAYRKWYRGLGWCSSLP